MATYTVLIAKRAQRVLDRLEAGTRGRIESAIEALGANPRPAGVVKLSGPEDLYRIRVGVYRVVYQIEDKLITVTVTRVGHRRDIYQKR